MRQYPLSRALLVDADDTLWENNIYYLECTDRFLDLMQSLGVDRQTAVARAAQVERRLIPDLGYGPDSYVAALGIACEQLLADQGIQAAPELLARARACGNLVLAPPMRLLPGVARTLTALHRNSQLVLVTKGAPAYQLAKLERSGLAHLFDARLVVAEKTVDTYRRIVSDLGLERSKTWMIGNSPRSDINPALKADIGAILIPHAHTWCAELAELDNLDQTVILERFEDLLPFFSDSPDMSDG